MAFSLRVLGAFAVRLRNPGSYQGPPEEGFSPSRKARKGQARSGSGITNRLEIHLLELPKYAPLDDNPPIADPRDPSSERKTVVPLGKSLQHASNPPGLPLESSALRGDVRGRRRSRQQFSLGRGTRSEGRRTEVTGRVVRADDSVLGLAIPSGRTSRIPCPRGVRRRVGCK